MIDDTELLRRYADERSEGSFSELVQRTAGLVYSAALRQVGGDTALAREVSQSVFIDLARKANSLSRRPVLASWLYTSTRFAALKALRAKQRRQIHEQEAQTMQAIENSSAIEANWEQLRPLLDSALCELSERDRSVVLMRYFESQPFAAMGEKLGIGESSARMRSERALGKLRTRLARRGIKSTAAALGLVIATNAVAVPPVGLTGILTTGALAHPATIAGGTGLLVKLYKFTAMKKIFSGIAATLAVGASVLASVDGDEHTKYKIFLVYAVCFGVGLLFALLSAVFGHVAGHGQTEFGHVDVHEAGAHGHAEAGAGLHDMPGFAPVGPTTIATFITAFGGLGMILTRIDATHRFSGLIAMAGALGIAALVGWFFTIVFRRTQASSEGLVVALVGQSATVITPIPINGVGEIAYVQNGSRYSAPARTETESAVATGTTVRIVRIIGNQFFVNST